MAIPVLKTGPLRSFRDYLADPVGFFDRTAQEYGELVKINILGKKMYLVTGPELLEDVFVKKFRSFPKGNAVKKMRLVLGEGLLTEDGESWKKHNRLIRKSFTVKEVRKLAPLFQKHADKTIKRWHSLAEKRVDLFEEFHHLSLKIIADSLFNRDLDEKKGQLNQDIQFLLKYLVDETRSLLPMSEKLPTRRNKKFRQTMERIHALFDTIIDERLTLLEMGEEPQDLLSFLLNKESQREMSRKRLRDEMMTLLIAGHETIANVLTWSFIHLAKDPALQERLAESGLSLEELEKNTLAKQVLNESMRLYPPVWILRRVSHEKTTLGTFTLPKKSMILIGIHAAHHHPVNWEDSESFRPERFAESTNPNSGIQGIRFLPFGYGPRTCIGNHMAYLEGQVIMLSLLKEFSFAFAEGEEKQEVNPGMTLTAKNNRQFKLTPRFSPHP